MTRAVPLSRFVVSPDQWERVLVHHAWGDVDMYFADLLGPRQEDETFMVSSNGDGPDLHGRTPACSRKGIQSARLRRRDKHPDAQR